VRAALAAEVPQGLKPIARELYVGLKRPAPPFSPDDLSCGRFKLTHYRPPKLSLERVTGKP
jgi:hypothetical protein